MAGYVIAVVTFALAFVFGTIRAVRPKLVLAVGAVLAVGWTATLAVAAAGNGTPGGEAVPLWFVVGLVALLYAIWCGGLWLGLRLRQTRGQA
jgi:hypothetical protein